MDMTTSIYKDNEQANTPLFPTPLDAAYFHSLEDYTAYSALVRKITRPAKQPAPIAYEITKDIGLIHQYCILREEMFKKVWGLSHFKPGKDLFDDISDIAVAKMGLQCIGGGRVTFSTAQKLPMESDNFILADAVPDLNLHEYNYCEVTRIAALPDFASDHILSQLIGTVLQKAIDEKCKYGFFISPLTMIRANRRAISHIGYKLNTRYDVQIPDREDYEGIKMYLSYIDYDKATKTVAAAVDDMAMA